MRDETEKPRKVSKAHFRKFKALLHSTEPIETSEVVSAKKQNLYLHVTFIATQREQV